MEISFKKSERCNEEQNDLYDGILKSTYNDLNDFFYNLNKVLQQNNPQKDSDFNNKISSKISFFRDLEKVQSEFPEKLQILTNCTFDSIKVKCKDTFSSEHYFILKFSHKNCYKIKEHSLPNLKELNVDFKDICSAVNEFSKCLCDVEEYLEAMDDIDSNCWVIDPKVTTCKDNYRRIMIDKDLSAMITVDVECALKPPSVKLLGRSKITNPLMEKIRENIDLWDSDESFITNLLNLFGLDQFPIKEDIDLGKSEDTEHSEKTCCICLSDKDVKGFITSVECERATCKQNFHATCLFQWLSAVSSNVQRFKHIHGECPSCSASISCPTDC